MDPTTAIAKPTGSPSPYQPAVRPMNPPTSAPTIPSSTVTMNPPGSRPGVSTFATIPTSRPNTIQTMIPMNSSLETDGLGSAKQAPDELGDRPVHEVQTKFFSLLGRGLTHGRLGQTERRHGDDVGAEPDGRAERKPERPGYHRDDLGGCAVDRADHRAERVVDDGARRCLLRLAEPISDQARCRGGDLDRRVVRFRLAASAISVREHGVHQTHRSRCQQAA